MSSQPNILLYIIIIKTIHSEILPADFRKLTLFIVPSEVENLSFGSLGRSYFNLNWTKPEGKYSGFTITYAMQGQTATRIDIGDVLQKEITGLEAGKEYTVSVFTIRGTDTSSGSTIKITTGDYYLMKRT